MKQLIPAIVAVVSAVAGGLGIFAAFVPSVVCR